MELVHVRYLELVDHHVALAVRKIAKLFHERLVLADSGGRDIPAGAVCKVGVGRELDRY